MFTVEDICDIFVDSSFQRVQIYDINTDKIVYNYYADEIPDNFRCLEVWSIDNISKNDDSITLNVSIED